MIAYELLNPLLPTLKPADSAGQALDWMEEFRTSQLAVVEGGQYRGLVSEETLQETDDSTPIEEIQPQHPTVFAGETQHLFEVLQLAQRYQLDVIPVLDEDHRFAGSISRTELLSKFADQLGTQEVGAVLVISLSERDYSLSEISRLVESNDVKIISSYFGTAAGELAEEETGSHLTLKLNRRDVNAVVATLERFGYAVEAAFASEPLESADRGRLDALFRYLDI